MNKTVTKRINSGDPLLVPLSEIVMIGREDDAKSDPPENQTPAQVRFKKDEAAQKAFANTVRLADVKSEDFDTLFYPGGHGTMWDLAEDPVSIALLESFYNSGASQLH